MLNNKYYFPVCSFPLIQIGTKPETSFYELQNYLEWNLSEKDKKSLYCFKQYTDVKNLKNIWLGKTIDCRGNFDEKDLNELFFIEEYFPQCVADFFKKYDSSEDRIKNFSLLEISFLNYQIKTVKNEFLRNFFLFEKEVKFVLAALRAKKFRRDISAELERWGKRDFLVESILAQKDSDSYDPPKEYEELKNIFLKHVDGDDPLALYKSILGYSAKKYISLSGEKPFTIDQILGYLAVLITVEDYYNLMDNHVRENGKHIISSFL